MTRYVRAMHGLGSTFKTSLALLGALSLAPLATLGCTDDGGTEASTTDTSGDGDTAGDGDGDTTGDGDGDGDTTGDGDGDTTGDGDGDGDVELPADLLDQLSEVSGCSDVFISATNPDGTLGLLFSGAEIAVTAHELGEAQMRVSELPSADVNLSLGIGTLLNDGCNDVGPGPQFEHEWSAVSGTVSLSVVPMGMQEPWAVPATATLELTNVSFEGEGLAPFVIDSLILADVYVGWFPG